MLNFDALQDDKTTIHDLTAGLTKDDLRRLTNEMVDEMLALIAGCVDQDVTFVPPDPEAHDPYAKDESEVDLSWTLGHVIVHTTASAEESAALAAELARGVKYHGRSRSEIPWRTVTTVQQCRHRLEESRRMRLASLDMWPDQPHLDNAYARNTDRTPIGPIQRFVLGLKHDHDHLEQIERIVRQAREARQPA